jgi:phosphoribosylformylglycinamidine synthase I
MKPRVLVLSGYGINCERETKRAFDIVGGDAEVVHVNDLISKERKLEDYQILVFPGGFSYGDDTGSGNAMASKIRLNLWDELMEFVNSGKLVLGICNGFQILVNLGLLPATGGEYGKRRAALSFNNSTKYECRWVDLKVNDKRCVFAKGIDRLHVPVAHGEGKFFAEEGVLDDLERNDQVVFRYCLRDGSPADGMFPFNPNGATRDIAGICDESGRVLGMMPHPERAVLSANSPDFQKEKEKLKRMGREVPECDEVVVGFFRNAVEHISEAETKEDCFSYADSGVNIELGDDVSKILYNAAKETWGNREGKLGQLIVPFDDFSGVRAIDVSGLPRGTLMNIGFDGVGTKMELAERIGDHSTIAFDLFAMVCDDAVVRGAEPVLIGSILDVNSLGKDGEMYIEQVGQLAKGYVDAARAANVAIVNGEVAELGSRVGGFGPFNYNWGAAVVWFADRDKLFTGQEIREGDSIVTFRERGFRSNGLSLARKVFQSAYGDNWHEKEMGGSSIGRLVLTPSKIYCKAIVDAHGGLGVEKRAEIHGVAHITGGGIPGKLGRILKPSGLGAELDNLFAPSEIMLHCQKLGKISDEEAYTTWNMGNGMVVITPEPEKVIAIARENGVEAQVAGRVVGEKGVRILGESDSLVFG